MTALDVADAALGPPPRTARLHRRFRVLRWLLAFAAIVPGSCIYALGRVEVVDLERLARDGRVAAARIAGMRAIQGRGTTFELTASFVADGREHVARDSVSRERFEATRVGDAVDVTYLPDAPDHNRLDRIDAERIERHAAAFVGGALALALAFAGAAWCFEHFARRALALLRRGRTAVATIVEPERRRWSARGAAHYVFHDEDGIERRGRSGFRTPVPDHCAPGNTATVLFDPQRPQRSALLASIEQLATATPRGHDDGAS